MSNLTDTTELLAPAGDWEALRAAAANGADAVYFGLANFNARHRAANFTVDELPAVIDYLHARNVRGYVTLNTLIFSEELPELEQMIAAIARAGTDAVIVQDLGLVRLIRRVAPELPVHGSTQMTLTEPRGIELARSVGIERAILARELSVREIAQIRQQTTLPIEVFVHGALCVAYSGQCLTSEALGGRSANRGQCAQACRLPYELIVDGKPRELGDVSYLLSPQDLAGYDLVDELVQLGVCSLKIEGRLKSAQYVAATTQTYRSALNAARAGKPFELDSTARHDLEQSFSRGFTPGFLAGLNHQQLVAGRFPKSRGVRVGTVLATTGSGVVVRLTDGQSVDIVKPGDGLVFDEGHPDQDEQGGRVYAVHPVPAARQSSSGITVELEFARGSLNLFALASGALVWKTDDPAFRRRMEHSYANDAPVQRVAIRLLAHGRIGGPLRLEFSDEQNHVASASWPGPLQTALKHPLTEELLRDQCGRLGDTPFTLGDVHLDVDGPVMAPKSVLNELRRSAIAALLEQRTSASRARQVNLGALDNLRHAIASSDRVDESPAAPAVAQMVVLVRTMEQLDALLAWQKTSTGSCLAAVYCDFEDVRRYREAVPKARAKGVTMGVATLRIIKPDEEGWLRHIARSEPDLVLARNLTAISFFREQHPEQRLIGDFSLNAANELTADLLRSWGLERIVPSYDLSWDQLQALARRIDPGLFEVVVHQHMPMFHMEHCVFAHTLSEGKDWRDCGRPCDRHRVELHDRAGANFPLLADTGCRNTVYNSVPQSASEYVPRMIGLGLNRFRVELLREGPEEIAPLLEKYARVLAGVDDGRQAWRGLQILNQLGVTRGTLRAD